MPVKLLNDEIKNQLVELFDAQLLHPVEIVFFSKDEPCDSCMDTRQLLEEVTTISDKLKLVTYDLEEDADIAQQFHIDLAPSLVITGRDGDTLLDYRLRYAGIPSGYEFSSLIQGILLTSRRDSGLKDEIRAELQKLTHPVDLKVFVTPT
jgi:alkyl hydroperoxide reductase subunit AhpF